MLLKTYCEFNVIHYYQLKQPFNFLPTHVEWLKLPSHDYFKWFTTDSSYDQYAKNWFAITKKMVIVTYLYGLKNIYPFISVVTTKNLKLF